MIGRHHDAADFCYIMQRLQGHYQLCRRAIGIGNDVLANIARHVFAEHMGIDLRHNQRHFRIITPERRVIDNDTTHGPDFRRPFLGYLGTRRHHAEIHFREIKLRQVFALQGLVAIGNFHAHGFPRSNGMHFISRKQTLRQNVQHLAAHISRGPNDCNFITHGFVLYVRPPGKNSVIGHCPGQLPHGRLTGEGLQAVFVRFEAVEYMARLLAAWGDESTVRGSLTQTCNDNVRCLLYQMLGKLCR